MHKRLYRSRQDQMIAGVCGGLGEYLSIDSVWIRLFFLLLLFATGFGFGAYIVLWLVVPEQGREDAPTSDIIQDNVQDMAERAREMGQSIQKGLQRSRSSDGAAQSAAGTPPGAIFFALACIFLGSFLLLKQLGLTWWLGMDALWPLLIIALGVALLVTRVKE